MAALCCRASAFESLSPRLEADRGRPHMPWQPRAVGSSQACMASSLRATNDLATDRDMDVGRRARTRVRARGKGKGVIISVGVKVGL